MSNILPLLPLTIPGACTPKEAVTKDALDKNSEILNEGSTLVARELVIVDGTVTASPDLTLVAPMLASMVYNVRNPESVHFITRWEEFDNLALRHSYIEKLIFLAHDIGTDIYFGDSRRSIGAITNELDKPEMPTIGTIVFEGCKTGLNVNQLLNMSVKLNLKRIDAWNAFISFLPIAADNFSDAQLQHEFEAGNAHILGPKSAAEARRQNLIVYMWLQAGNVKPENFPLPWHVPADLATSPEIYREDQGFFARNKTTDYILKASLIKPFTGNADLAQGELSRDYYSLSSRQPGSGSDSLLDTYEYLKHVIVF